MNFREFILSVSEILKESGIDLFMQYSREIEDAVFFVAWKPSKGISWQNSDYMIPQLGGLYTDAEVAEVADVFIEAFQAAESVASRDVDDRRPLP